MMYTDADCERFLAKVAIPDDPEDRLACWPWQGAKHGQNRGYGKFHLDGKTISAHRAAFLLFVGDLEEGQVVGHKCNNEQCVSPWHLEATSQSENMTYCVQCGRHNSQQEKE
jgi:hypothetical protein